MTRLAEDIRQQIATTGPMTLAEYMTICLSHPIKGYYITRDPLGAAGDFTTAPEISQMFGELIGLALAQAWLDRGGDAPFHLVELGPGRGTLMADVLRATARVPGFHAALNLHLVETSPALRQRQSKTIDHALTHHDHLADVPDDAPLYLIANEFFDALPIRQFERTGPAWRERLIGLDDKRALSFGLSDPLSPEFLDHRIADTLDGDIVEVSPAAQDIARQTARRIQRHGGLALIIDYGGWRSLGDTFQALQSHKSVSPLAAPGEADLTAHVDFEAIARSATDAGAQVSGMTPQGDFLHRLGIAERTEALAKNLSGGRLESHMAAYRRLTSGDEMGTLFKVLAITRTGSPALPGFTA